ncbi:unnamed protein product [Brassica oleracea var. botrytis]
MSYSPTEVRHKQKQQTKKTDKEKKKRTGDGEFVAEGNESDTVQVNRNRLRSCSRRYSRNGHRRPSLGFYARMWARDYSAFFAALCGIESAMSAIRGKDDITNHLVSGSGAGLALSFLRQGFKLRPAHALSSVAVFAVIQATIYKVKETIKSRNAQDALYTEARAMLSMLGLEEYEKNFKKGRLTDPTLPLLTDRLYIHTSFSLLCSNYKPIPFLMNSDSRELREVNIPPGARLLILDHIKRFVHKLLYFYMDQIYEFYPTILCCFECRYPKMVNRK